MSSANKYDQRNIQTMELVYGRGYLSAGGDEEVANELINKLALLSLSTKIVTKDVRGKKTVTANLKINNKTMLENYDKLGVSGLKDYIYSKMWNPNYRPLVYMRDGKGE